MSRGRQGEVDGGLVGFAGVDVEGDGEFTPVVDGGGGELGGVCPFVDEGAVTGDSVGAKGGQVVDAF